MIDVALVSLGCPKHLVDSENMIGLLPPDRYRFTPRPEEAEIIIVNTCAFIEPAREESRRIIAELAERKDGRCRILAVTGCLVQYYGPDIADFFPDADLFVGVGEYENLSALLEEAFSPSFSQRIVRRDTPAFPFQIRTDRKISGPGHFAYLRLADGCDNCCSYCLIPSLRGPYQPRSFTSIVEEADNLVTGGARELILIAQDTSYYGSLKTEGGDLSRLLSELSAIPDLNWVRLLYTHPDHLDETILTVMNSSPRICNYLDLPVQHISDRILRRMGRRAGRDEIEKLLDRTRRLVPGIALRTTVMTGFPGESKEDFRQLEEFIRHQRFDHLGVFSYSAEPGTAAADMDGQIDPGLAAARRDRLMEIQQGISAARLRDRLGTVAEVIVDGVFPEKDSKLWVGRTRFQAPEIDGLVVIEGEGITPGDMIRVKMTSSSEYDLYGVRVK